MRYLYIILLILSLLSSCTEEVNLVYPTEKSQLVVNSIINPDSAVKVKLYKTQNIQDSLDCKIENAEIKLFENNTFIGNLSEIEKGVYTIDYYPQTKHTYRIEVVTSEFEPAYAEEYLPDSVHVSGGTYEVETWYDEQDMTAMSTCSFTIHDTGNETNFYELKIWKENDRIVYDTITYEEIIDKITHIEKISQIVCKDPVMEAEGISSYKPSTLFFSDKLFNGTDYTFSFDCLFFLPKIVITYDDGTTITTYNNKGIRFMMQIRSISENYYNYRTSWTRHYYNQKLHELSDVNEIVQYMFSAEPVRMFSNTENSLGIFVGYSGNNTELIWSGNQNKKQNNQ